jgi:hypothetical protein
MVIGGKRAGSQTPLPRRTLDIHPRVRADVLLSVAVGFMASRGAGKSSTSYFLAGKNSSPIVTASECEPLLSFRLFFASYERVRHRNASPEHVPVSYYRTYQCGAPDPLVQRPHTSLPARHHTTIHTTTTRHHTPSHGTTRRHVTWGGTTRRHVTYTTTLRGVGCGDVG